MRGMPEWIKQALAWIVVVGAIVATWIILDLTGAVSSDRLPPLTDVISAAGREAEDLPIAVLATAGRVAAGFVIGAVVGVFIALLSHLSTVASELLAPPIHLLRSFPPFVVAPFIILWFGLSVQAPIVFAATVTAFVVVIDSGEALRVVRREYPQAAQALGAGHVSRAMLIDTPAIIPAIAGGLRVALVGAVNAVLLYEMLTGTEGVGDLLIRGYQLFRIDTLFFAVIVAILLSLLLDRILVLLLNRATHWSRG